MQLPSPLQPLGSPGPQVPPGSTYLDQIAGQPTVKKMNPLILWVLIGGGILVLGLLVIFMLNLLKPKTPEQLTQFVYRVEALQELTGAQAKNIQSSKLVALDGNVNSILAGIQQEGAPALAAQGVKKLALVPPKASAVALEYAEIASRLDDARLNAAFDRTYVREITYQLGRLRAEIQTIRTGTHSSTVLDFLSTSDSNLKPLEEAYSNYVAS